MVTMLKMAIMLAMLILLTMLTMLTMLTARVDYHVENVVITFFCDTVVEVI